MLKKVLLFGTVLGLIILAFSFYQTGNVGDKGKQHPDKIVIADESERVFFNLIDSNLKAINDKNIDAYLVTLVPNARDASQKEITDFIDQHQIKISLESFQVLKKDDSHALIETKQKAINLGKSKYRNHIATANHTLKKVDGTWLIESTTMVDTQFIDK